MHFFSRLNMIGIIALVLLRVGIGWHFYMEGVTKVRKHDFDSEGFLKAAEGPMADKFHAMVWDYDGAVRLDKVRLTQLFSDEADKAEKHFGLTAQQTETLKKAKKQFAEFIEETFDEGGDDVAKYWAMEKRIKQMAESPVYNDLNSLNSHLRKVQKDRRAAVADTLKAVDGLWKDYEAKLNSIATKEQRAASGPFLLNRPGEGVMNTTLVNKIIPIFDMAIGILLILGLLTPVAATLGGLFLLSVVLSQMPGYPGTAPTYFQAVECLAMFVLAGTDAGRYAGLDFIPWTYWRNRRAAAERRAAAAALRTA